MYYYFLTQNGNPIKISIFNRQINLLINNNYVEFTNEQKEFYLQHPNASIYEIRNCNLYSYNLNEDELTTAKRNKIIEIEQYDCSENINGFYYNNIFMWLDRETRACLKNTIESMSLLGRDELVIWYNGNNITLDLNSARLLLAALEVYATDCYNVTEQHKKEISDMTNINDINAFDITADYPNMLHFG